MGGLVSVDVVADVTIPAGIAHVVINNAIDVVVVAVDGVAAVAVACVVVLVVLVVVVVVGNLVVLVDVVIAAVFVVVLLGQLRVVMLPLCACMRGPCALCYLTA